MCTLYCYTCSQCQIYHVENPLVTKDDQGKRITFLSCCKPDCVEYRIISLGLSPSFNLCKLCEMMEM